VWSTAWVRNPEAELSSIDAALAKARAKAKYTTGIPLETDLAGEDSYESMDGDDPDDPPTIEVTPSRPSELRLADYMLAQLPQPALWAELRSETTDKLVQLIVRITEVEGPVHRTVVIERLRQSYGLGRVTGTTRDHVEHAITMAQRGGQVQGNDTFIWIGDAQLGRAPRRPVDGNIDHMPPTELKEVVLSTSRAVFGAPRGELVIEASRLLGFSRSGGRITEVLSHAVQELLDEGKLAESFGMIHAVDRAEEVATDLHGEWRTGETDLVSRLQAKGLEVIDKRTSGGAIWVIGGPELKPTLTEFEQSALRFRFAPGGGQSTSRRPAWWTRE
jgi:hypothetical protein